MNRDLKPAWFTLARIRLNLLVVLLDSNIGRVKRSVSQKDSGGIGRAMRGSTEKGERRSGAIESVRCKVGEFGAGNT